VPIRRDADGATSLLSAPTSAATVPHCAQLAVAASPPTAIAQSASAIASLCSGGSALLAPPLAPLPPDTDAPPPAMASPLAEEAREEVRESEGIALRYITLPCITLHYIT
jgi:hypothetical protein